MSNALPHPSAFLWLKEKRENLFSQFGEDGLLEAIFDRIGTTNRYCCECGAADGVLFSNTRKLILEGWSSLQIEADEVRFAKLAELYRDRADRVTCFHYRVAPTGAYSFDRLLAKAGAPEELDLLVIDVDGPDYWLFNSLVRYRPRVVVCEYDPSAEPGFVPGYDCAGQAGRQAVIDLGIGHYYWPVAITQTNVIFVQQELASLVAGAPDEQVYAAGRWQDCTSGGAVACSSPQELAEYEAGRLPKRIRPDAVLDHSIEVAPKVAAVGSTPRFGPLSTMDCILQSIVPLGISWFRGEGAFWHHSLSRAISRALKIGAELIVTFDYDTIFSHGQFDNDVARLVCLMMDHPDVDAIVAAQMKREGGPLLATTDVEIKLLEPLVPITQGHFGLSIFRASVFERLDKPWFWEQANDAGEWEENRIDADIGFWKNCQANGINVQMSLDVLVGHLEVVVTWPGQNLTPVYQPLNDWRDRGKHPDAFDRQKVIAAVRANPALLYGAKLEMGG